MLAVRNAAIAGVVLTAILLTFVGPAHAGWPGWSRHWGHGWSDGYHAGSGYYTGRGAVMHSSMHSSSPLPGPSWTVPLAQPFTEGEPLPAAWPPGATPQGRHDRSGSSKLRGASLFRQAGEGSSVTVSGHAAGGL
jgi:hypothetical protein